MNLRIEGRGRRVSKLPNDERGNKVQEYSHGPMDEGTRMEVKFRSATWTFENVNRDLGR